MATLTKHPDIEHPYVTRKPGVCGGKPIIVGTRIKVSLVAREYEQMGMTPEKIVEAHPHLTLAHIHGALSYYYDHKSQILAELQETEETMASLSDGAGPSAVAERLRAAGKLR